MAGGLIQLAAYGAQSSLLDWQSKYLIFINVFIQYTNFAMEKIRLNFEGNSIFSNDQTSKLICKIDRNADWFNCYFRFNLLIFMLIILQTENLNGSKI